MRFALTLILALALGSCANNKVLKKSATIMPHILDKNDAIDMQRPEDLPMHALIWNAQDELYQGLVIDYISGMSKRDLLFHEPNQKLYRLLLNGNLKSAGLLAPSPLSARYGLQVEFDRLKTPKIGIDYKGKTAATYRLVDRQSGEVIHESLIESSFKGVYTELHEDDFSKPLLHPEQSAIAPVTVLTGLSVIARPAISLITTFDPRNYINLNVWYRDMPKAPAKTRNGALSTRGFASRNGTERARQVNYQVLHQSIILFLKELADSQKVPVTHLVSCNKFDATPEMLTRIALGDLRVQTDDCLQYQTLDETRPDHDFAHWQ